MAMDSRHPDGEAAAAGGDGRRGEARGRLPSDRLARDQRRARRCGPRRASACSRRCEARLPAELGGARARDRPLEDARRRQLRHHALRPGVDAVRDRARRARGGLLHQHRQPAHARPRRRSSSAVERLRVQGVEGILVIAPQTDAAHARAPAPGGRAGRRRRGGPGRRRSACRGRSRAPARPRRPQHLLELGHRTVWHIAGPGDWLEAQQRVAGWQRALEPAGAEPPPALLGDWSPRVRLRARPATSPPTRA